MKSGVADAELKAANAHRRNLTWWILAPVLALMVLAGWAFASPVGAGPDDDYHLISVWCVGGSSEYCQPVGDPNLRAVPVGFADMLCFAQKGEQSAECQVGAFPFEGQETFTTGRGNFSGKYPPVYYSVMRAFAGTDVEASAVVMRLFNAILFVGLATAVVALLPAARRQMAVWGWLVSLVPLGMFLIPSNNPSSWSITGVGVAFLALRGWFETHGDRKWALGALYLVGVLLAGGSRGDAAVFTIGATGVVLILTANRSREWLMQLPLPLVGLVLSGVLLSMSGQGEVAVEGFPSEGGGPTSDPIETTPGLGLVAYNLMMLPDLWSGVFGTWALGWFDVVLPAVVYWGAAAAFLALIFKGLGQMTSRKALSIVGVLAVLVVLPVYTLSVGGHTVGENFQPRYILPLMVLFAMVALDEPTGLRIRLTRVQATTVLIALAVANAVALQVNLRRYVTGTEQQGPNLDAGAQWWWPGAGIGPTLAWLVASLSFAALLAMLWTRLVRVRPSLHQ